ncbi:hypothetical protein [Dyadobacter sp. CY323]|uniref:hypothetical protein n=1 Tax=Dyadobacter sp. CY323 TaxID=2907302 RepID=UPI001F1DA231|nr:hypothetical protein [Dyadobacter sp. CY323]MCE6990990.1 hypothetical protein [Dyadobacter sp. CY323]
MRNEKLFEKIKQTTWSETPDVEEWDPEKVWAYIEKKHENKKIWLWWPYAAASILLIVGIWFSTDKVDHPVNVVKEEIAKSDVVKPEIGIKLKLEKSELITSKKSISKPLTHKKYLTKNDTNAFNEDVIESYTLNEDTIPPTKIDTIQTPELNANLPLVAIKPDEKPREKVLVAKIAFPEQKPVELTGLQKMFELARREREARKMRIQLIDSKKESGFWSFVHHSFVENPTSAEPAQLPKE